MGGLSLPHLFILALVVLVLFGRGRISEMMGDFGKGIKSFKRGIEEESDGPAEAPPLKLAHDRAPSPAQSAAASASTPSSLVGAPKRSDTR
jgi:sec-independent protein translocase protein TatA